MESIMRLATKTMIALGFVGAIAGGVSSPVAAQGIYFGGPGVSVGIGTPYYHHRYYRHYGYAPSWAYAHPWRYRPHYRSWGW